MVFFFLFLHYTHPHFFICRIYFNICKPHYAFSSRVPFVSQDDSSSAPDVPQHSLDLWLYSANLHRHFSKFTVEATTGS
jgi:hypothetical protein